MASEISQEGVANIAFQNVENTTVNITQQFAKSVKYQELISQLKILQDLLSYIPESEIEKRLSVGNQINEIESIIENFEQDVLALAETFNRIETNTERLIQAKKFFDKGDFDKSRSVLENEIEQIKDEQVKLLEQHEKYEKEILPKLKQNSEEFLILALSERLNNSPYAER